MALDSFNGFLDGTGNSSFGAHADHSHDNDYAAKNHNHDDKYSAIDHNHDTAYEPKNAAIVKATKVTIAADDWEESSATVEFPEGLTAYITYIVDNASASAATTAALELTTVGDSGLTFGVTTTPEDAIDLYILYL